MYTFRFETEQDTSIFGTLSLFEKRERIEKSVHLQILDRKNLKIKMEGILAVWCNLIFDITILSALHCLFHSAYLCISLAKVYCVFIWYSKYIKQAPTTCYNIFHFCYHFVWMNMNGRNVNVVFLVASLCTIKRFFHAWEGMGVKNWEIYPLLWNTVLVENLARL